MSECLYCGDCCKRFSPLAPFAGEPCPHLVEIGDMCLCSVYERRPDECKKHDFPFRFCPIGMDILGLRDPIKIGRRIDAIYTHDGMRARRLSIQEIRERFEEVES